MARVEVTAGTVSDGRIQSLKVQLSGLPGRQLDREQALSWMRDGHSFIPVLSDSDLPALQLVEILDGGEAKLFIRADTQNKASDSLPFGD